MSLQIPKILGTPLTGSNPLWDIRAELVRSKLRLVTTSVLPDRCRVSDKVFWVKKLTPLVWRVCLHPLITSGAFSSNDVTIFHLSRVKSDIKWWANKSFNSPPLWRGQQQWFLSYWYYSKLSIFPLYIQIFTDLLVSLFYIYVICIYNLTTCRLIHYEICRTGVNSGLERCCLD